MQAVVFGEAMLEVSTLSTSGGLRYGGDTLNTAVHLARLGWSVQFVTALGRDAFSDALCQAWAGQGVDTRHVLRHAERQPGIYAIHNDETGERSFLYWRGASAAREMFSQAGIEDALESAASADLMYFSLISLAILPPEARQRLLDLAARRRTENRPVAYDANYRPALWSSPEEARDWSNRACACADIGLPTLSDEQALHAENFEADVLARRWNQFGCGEVAVKQGADGCTVLEGEAIQQIAPAHGVRVIDASGAGDAFNAGYLAGRLQSASVWRSVRSGHAVAEWVIGRAGALPDIDPAAPYAEIRQSLSA